MSARGTISGFGARARPTASPPNAAAAADSEAAPSLRGGRAQQDQLDAAVHLTTLGGVVVGARLLVAASVDADAVGGAEDLPDAVAHGLGARQGQLEIRREAQIVDRLLVGMADYRQRPRRLLQCLGDV